jgi:hypothetical protein
MFTTQAYMQRFTLLSLSLLIVSALFTVPALADSAPSSEDIKRAATAYDQGRERFREEQYIEAAEKFETADSYAPSAAALRLAIFARKEAGQVDRALTHAALALELYPENAELRAEAQAVIDESGNTHARVVVSCDEPCELLLNNRIVHGRASKSRTVYVPPGRATIRASWSEGRTQSEIVTVNAGGFEELSFYSPEIPTTPTSTSPGDYSTNGSDAPLDDAKQGGWHPAVFGTGLALTIVGVGVTTGLGIRAKNNPGRDAVLENCEKGDTACPEFKEGVKNQLQANVALGATAAVGVFTIVSAFLTNWKGKKKEDVYSLAGRESEDRPLVQARSTFSVRPTLEIGNGASLGAAGTF